MPFLNISSPYRAGRALAVSGENSIIEDFDSLLAAPWYDSAVTSGHLQGTNPDDATNCYEYQWEIGEDEAPLAQTARRKLNSATDILDVTFDAWADSTFDPQNGDHLFYVRLNTSTDYAGLTGGFTFYIQPYGNGQLHIDWRLSDDSTWDSEVTVGAPDFHSDTPRTIRARLEMNDNGSANGILQVWVDGELYIDRSDCTFRQAANEQFQQIIIAPYIGATQTSQSSMYIDNLAVYDAYQGILATPGSFVATAGDEQVVLSWASVAGASSYEYRVDGGSWVSTGATLGATVTGLTNGVEYDFEARAYDGAAVYSEPTSVLSRTPAVASDTLLAISASIATAGRIGFYVDYSELSGVGTHTFYVARTHGSAGAVTVDYDSYGDSHTTITGTLSWADGEMDIKTITAVVGSKSDGEHRMYVDLSNATGGSVLQQGDYTRAYGVIDDDSIAGDSDAVFFDTAWGGTQSGTQSEPYDNIYSAISNVGSKRYIYGKGTVTPDGTNTGGPYGNTIDVITMPATRASEATRCIVRNWPGSTLTIDGTAGGSNTSGFYYGSTKQYLTFKGITFSNFSTTGPNYDAFGLWFHYGTSGQITVEYCDFDDINGSSGSNTAGLAFYADNGCKMWRCSGDNILVAGSASHNTATAYSYDGQKFSVQRCSFGSNQNHGVYHKRTASGDISITAKFNMFDDCALEMGNSSQGHGGTLICNNVYQGALGKIIHDVDNNGNIQTDNQVSNNYFYNNGSSGDDGSILAWNDYHHLVCFGNIYDGSSKALIEYSNSAAVDRYVDYNVTNGASVGGELWRIDGATYSTSAAMDAAISQGTNDTEGDPDPTNAAGDDFTLGGSSVATGANIGGTDCGPHWTGIEIMGA